MFLERESHQSSASNTDQTPLHFSINLGTVKLSLISEEIV